MTDEKAATSAADLPMPAGAPVDATSPCTKKGCQTLTLRPRDGATSLMCYVHGRDGSDRKQLLTERHALDLDLYPGDELTVVVLPQATVSPAPVDASADASAPIG